MLDYLCKNVTKLYGTFNNVYAETFLEESSKRQEFCFQQKKITSYESEMLS